MMAQQRHAVSGHETLPSSNRSVRGWVTVAYPVRITEGPRGLVAVGIVTADGEIVLG
jgi:hypothetical protein